MMFDTHWDIFVMFWQANASFASCLTNVNTEKNVLSSLLYTVLSSTPGLNEALCCRVLMGMKPAASDWSTITLNLDEMYNCQWLKHVKFLY